MDLAFQEFIVSAKQIATKPRAQNYTSWSPGFTYISVILASGSLDLSA
jgi:hypothetical protein